MPDFAGFMRVHVLESKFSQSVRSLLGTSSGKASQNTKRYQAEPFDMNQPRSTFDSRRRGQKAPYYDVDQTWLMSSRATVDIEHHAQPLQPMYEGKGVRVKKSVVVEEAKGWSIRQGRPGDEGGLGSSIVGEAHLASQKFPSSQAVNLGTLQTSSLCLPTSSIIALSPSLSCAAENPSLWVLT